METKTYYVGDRPGGSTVFTVLNQRTGFVEDLSNYTTARVLFLDSDNRLIELDDINTDISDAANGEVTFLWPNESIFTKPGRYVLQIELSSGSARRSTTVQDYLIREHGGITK